MPFAYAPPQYRGQDPFDPQLLHVTERGGPDYGIAMDEPSYSSPYQIPGRHTSTIDNGALTQSPYAYDQPEVQYNLASRALAGRQPVQQAQQDPLETLSQRYRPNAPYRDILAGKTQAGLSSLPFLEDEQFRNAPREVQNEIARRYSGHSLDEQQQAEQSGYGGTPWSTIANQQLQNKQRSTNLRMIREEGNQLGGDLGEILRNFDPKTGQSVITTVNARGDEVPHTYPMPWGDYDQYLRRYNASGLVPIQAKQRTSPTGLGMGDRRQMDMDTNAQYDYELQELARLRAMRASEQGQRRR